METCYKMIFQKLKGLQRRNERDRSSACLRWPTDRCTPVCCLGLRGDHSHSVTVRSMFHTPTPKLQHRVRQNIYHSLQKWILHPLLCVIKYNLVNHKFYGSGKSASCLPPYLRFYSMQIIRAKGTVIACLSFHWLWIFVIIQSEVRERELFLERHTQRSRCEQGPHAWLTWTAVCSLLTATFLRIECTKQHHFFTKNSLFIHE